ncbi:MAG: sodium-dependent bicarbonate transport family permease [Thermodesulfobacteriota bacterium]
MIENLLDPAVLCFGLGLLAGVLGADIRLPGALYETLSVYLLLAIGLKGGVDLASAGFAQAAPGVGAALALGAATPLLAYPVLRMGGLDRPNAGALSAHYGSVSAVTFAVCLGFLDREGVSYEAYVAVMLAFMEIPALAVGILLARGLGNNSGRWGEVSREILLGKGVFFLVAGLVVGAVAGPQRTQAVAPLFFGLFKGALVLFLLEMGLVASRQLRDLAKLGPFLVGFGTLAPLCFGLLGAAVGTAVGLSVGGTAVLATLAASASYIAAPAAMRLAVPEANPSIYLTTSLGITFPFNLVWGIPLYLWMARFAAGLLG